MSEARKQLISLLRIQELAIEIREAQRVVEDAPHRIEEIEQRFRERNAEYVALKDRNDELELDQRTRSSELGGLEQSKQKFMDDLMQVKNQREYAAMLKEIDAVKAQISDHEEAILRDMEEIEKLTGDLQTHKEHIAIEREAVAKERTEVTALAEDARRNIEQLTKERGKYEATLPHAVLRGLRRLEPRRQGIFLAKAENGTCQSCYVRMRPQVFQEIRTGVALHSCDNCKRFLYHPSLRQETEPARTSDDVQAANGGAV